MWIHEWIDVNQCESKWIHEWIDVNPCESMILSNKHRQPSRRVTNSCLAMDPQLAVFELPGGWGGLASASGQHLLIGTHNIYSCCWPRRNNDFIIIPKTQYFPSLRLLSIIKLLWSKVGLLTTHLYVEHWSILLLKVEYWSILLFSLLIKIQYLHFA